MGLERPRFGTAMLERLLTRWTARDLLAGCRGPISGTARQGQILQHPGAHPVQSRIQFQLDLT
jgi:hypothetical protein